MLTQCPSCQTTFRVTSEILRVADGQVRCGRCQTQFDALERLIEENDAGEIQSGRYLRPPGRMTAPEAAETGSTQIEVEEPVTHEDITMEGRHIEISGTYEIVDEDDQGRRQVREEVVEEWVEFDALNDALIDEAGSEPDEHESAQPAIDTGGDIEHGIEAELDADIEVDIDTDIGADIDAGIEPEIDAGIGPELDAGVVAGSAAEPDLDAASAAHDEQLVPQGDADEHSARGAGRYRALDALGARGDDELELLAPASARRTPWIWKALLAPLALLLLGQVVHDHRGTLARHPRLGPPLIDLYAALGLDLHPQWNLHAYELRQWGIVSDPASPGTLKVRASIKNLAGFAQPYPLLKLVLEDRWGEQVRARAFEPSEYLDPATAPDRLLAPAQQANATIAIVDPGPDAEGFRFDVCLRGTAGPVCAADVPSG